MFNDEYLIEFNLSLNRGKVNCFVNKTDITPLQDNEGLVKVVVYATNKKSCSLGINDLGAHMVSNFSVLEKDVVRI